MASGESFDPRTWQRGDPAPAAAPVTAVKPAAVAGAAQPDPVRASRWWLGPLLSAIVLAGGALAAYETRGDTASAAASSAQ